MDKKKTFFSETELKELGRKEMVTYSSNLAWRITWTEEPWQATVHRVAKSGT